MTKLGEENLTGTIVKLEARVEYLEKALGCLIGQFKEIFDKWTLKEDAEK